MYSCWKLQSELVDVKGHTSSTACTALYMYTTIPQWPLFAYKGLVGHLLSFGGFSKSLIVCHNLQGIFWASDGACTQHSFSSRWKVNKHTHLDIWSTIYIVEGGPHIFHWLSHCYQIPIFCLYLHLLSLHQASLFSYNLEHFLNLFLSTQE